MKKGFTLIEMIVVIGIIMILIGASIGGYSRMTKTAEKTKAQELVSNVATAFTAYFQDKGSWPRVFLSKGTTGGEIDENVALVLARGNYLSLSTDKSDPKNATALTGVDRFGIVSPWATAAIKRKGNNASLGTTVPGSTKTVQDHRLWFAIDLDGDGIIEGASIGGESVNIRATAAVWCGGKDGVIEAYSVGRKKDDVYSWTYGQTRDVK